MKPPPFPKVERPSAPLASPLSSRGTAKGRALLKDAVAALMVAGPEINQEGRCQGLFSILEHLGVDGLPQKESEGEPDSGGLQDLACAVSDLLYGGELGWTSQPMIKTIADLRDRFKELGNGERAKGWSMDSAR